MKIMIAAALFFMAACSKPAVQDKPAAGGSSNAEAARRLRADMAAPPLNEAVTVAAGAVERLEAFAALTAPDTPGNPYEFKVCATLFDKDGRPVAAEGEFFVKSELVSGGAYIYAPMYSPLSFPLNSSPLGVCPTGRQLWPDSYLSNRGKSFLIEVSFKDGSGKTVSAATTFLY